MAVLSTVGQLIVCNPLLPDDSLEHRVAIFAVLPSDKGGTGVEEAPLKDDIMIQMQGYSAQILGPTVDQTILCSSARAIRGSPIHYNPWHLSLTMLLVA
jgi:hypothetical protein